MSQLLAIVVSALGFAVCGLARFLPPASHGYRLKSSLNPNITISYNRPDSDTASFTIRLNGDPGASSMTSLLNEIGPCEAVRLKHGYPSTLAREWGVAFIYGDADIICNGVGSEAGSFELACITPYRSAFSNTGYIEAVVNGPYTSGHLRQYGNPLFSGIFKAVQKNNPSPQLRHPCWIRPINTTCTENQKQAIRRGDGLVNHGQGLKESETPTPRSGASRLQLGIHYNLRRQLGSTPIGGGLLGNLNGLGSMASRVNKGLIGGLAAAGGVLLL